MTRQEGYVFKEKKAWYVRYRDWTTDKDGALRRTQRCKRLCEATGEYRSKSAARSLAEEFLRPLNNGALSGDATMTFAGFVETEYLPFSCTQHRPSTYAGYEQLFNRYLKQRMALPLREYRTIECEQLLQHITAEYQVNGTTLKHIKHFLSGVFRYAIRTGRLQHNPVRDVVLPKANPPRETHAYALEEIARMLQVLPEPLNVLVAVAAFTGLRRGELRALRLTDYDGSTITVRCSRWRKYEGPPKGKHGTGTIPVIAPLQQLLNSYLRTWSPKEYLFHGPSGKPLHLEYEARDHIRPVLKEHGIPWHGWHAFRRGLATNLHELGVADIVIQAILRHSDVAVTRSAYIKRNGVDARSQDAMHQLEVAVCNQRATNTNTQPTVPRGMVMIPRRLPIARQSAGD